MCEWMSAHLYTICASWSMDFRKSNLSFITSVLHVWDGRLYAEIHGFSYGIHISFFFLSLEWAIYKVWVLREYRPSSSNQINNLMVPVFPVCLSSTCEMWASHLFFICSVCSPCLFPHTHLLSLSLSLEGWDWISVLTISTAPAPLQND